MMTVSSYSLQTVYQPRLKLHWLVALVAVWRFPELKEAAAHLSKSPGYIKRSLKSLQKEMSDPLYTLFHGRVVLTVLGSSMAEDACVLLNQSLGKLSQNAFESHALKMGFSHPMLRQPLLKQSQTLSELLPLLNLQLLSLSSQHLEKTLIQEQLDFGVLPFQPRSSGLRWVCGKPSPYVMVSSQSGNKSWKDFTFVRFTDADWTYAPWMIFVKQQPLMSMPLDVLVECLSTQNLAAYVPRFWVAKALKNKRLQCLGAPPELKYFKPFLCWKAGRKPTSLDPMLIQHFWGDES